MTNVLQPRKKPTQARSEATVKAILDATARVLVEHGYAGANTNLIAQTAGISVGSLYQYFPNRDSLVAALHERHVKQVEATFEHVVTHSGRSLKEDIRALVHAAVAIHQHEPKLHAVLESEIPHLDRLDGSRATDRAIYQLLLGLLQRHRPEIVVRNLRLATFVVGEIVHALIHAAIIEAPAAIDAGALERETVRAVLGYLGCATSGPHASKGFCSARGPRTAVPRARRRAPARF